MSNIFIAFRACFGKLRLDYELFYGNHQLSERMKIISSADIFNPEKLKAIIENLTALKTNLIIFGLPSSGKSTLVKAICRSDKQFITLEEEEILSQKDHHAILTPAQNWWCVSHQFPGQIQSIPAAELEMFTFKMGLKAEKWAIVKIEK